MVLKKKPAASSVDIVNQSPSALKEEKKELVQDAPEINDQEESKQVAN